MIVYVPIFAHSFIHSFVPQMLVKGILHSRPVPGWE